MKKLFTLVISCLVVAISLSPLKASANSFSDLDSTNKNFIAIEFLKDNGIIQGYPDGTFKPNNTVNRAELMKILIGDLPGQEYGNCFTDVGQEWFAPYVCYAKQQKWIEGYSDGTFKPAQTVNRAEAIKMAIEVFGMELPEQLINNPFGDTDKNAWFTKYVQVAKDSGLLYEDMQSFLPSNGMTRGDISEIIYRLLVIQKLQIEKYIKKISGQAVLPPQQNQYNFIPPEEDFLGHCYLDIQPWIEWGSSAQDTTTKEERIQYLIGTEWGVKALSYLGYEEDIISLYEAIPDKDAHGYYLLGNYYFDENDFEEAIKNYKKSFDMNIESDKLNDTEWHIMISRFGVSYGITGDYENALEIFNFGAENSPEFPDFYYGIACTYAEMGNAEKAIENLDKTYLYIENVLPGDEGELNPLEDPSFESLLNNSEFLEIAEKF